MIHAIIDIGTNTTRLLVKDSSNHNELSRKVSITRLGAGMDSSGSLSAEAMERTRKQVIEYVNEAISLGAQHANVFATAGCRASSNGSEFIESLNGLENIKAEIIDGDTEAKTSFNGAVGGFDLSHTALPIAVIDIGGGSTEIAVSSMTDSKVCHSFVSIPIGSARITERYLESDPPLPEELTNAIGDVRDSIADAIVANPYLSNAKTFIGVAATFTTAAAIEIGMREFDATKIHGFILTREMAEDVFRTLATEDLESRKFNPGLEPERAHLIVGGLCILVGVMRHFDLAQISISCTDLLDGLYQRVV